MGLPSAWPLITLSAAHSIKSLWVVALLTQPCSLEKKIKKRNEILRITTNYVNCARTVISCVNKGMKTKRRIELVYKLEFFTKRQSPWPSKYSISSGRTHCALDYWQGMFEVNIKRKHRPPELQIKEHCTPKTASMNHVMRCMLWQIGYYSCHRAVLVLILTWNIKAAISACKKSEWWCNGSDCK